MIAVLVVSYDAFAEFVRHGSLAQRVLAVLLYLAPPGLAMGAGFPLAVRALGVDHPLLVPSAFLWNGVASILAGPIAVMIAMDRGFTVTLLAGAGCYVLTAVTLWVVRGRQASAAGAG